MSKPWCYNEHEKPRRARWPKWDPMFCTKHEAAMRGLEHSDFTDSWWCEECDAWQYSLPSHEHEVQL